LDSPFYATPVSLDQISGFDDIIDVRTPLEFAVDHIPGAINAPVLGNEERVVIGTMYKQVGAFEATRVGAAMVAKNIAAHLDTLFADRPRNWRPLVYCWRGGKRSQSMVTWFNLIGWRARQLGGGYKTYRSRVLEELVTLPRQFHYIVLTGHTGSGKTRLLNALEKAGAQTLDLEALAAHRGSLLGALPGQPQPSQKAFDTALVHVLRRFDSARAVFVEAESRRIGSIALATELVNQMRDAACVNVDAPRDERVELLLQDYSHLFGQPDFFRGQLLRLTPLHGHQQIRQWLAMIDANQRRALFSELVDKHYDPAYARSSRSYFRRFDGARHFTFHPVVQDEVEQARALLAQLGEAGSSVSAQASLP